MKDFQSIKRVLFEVIFVSIPFILISCLLVIRAMDETVERAIDQQNVRSYNANYVAKPYPILNQSQIPLISAYAALIMDDASQVVLYAKNLRFRFSMASTTKLMTALVGLDYFASDDILTVRRSGVEGAIIGFPLRERLFFDDLLYAMLLPSGNDAAYAIADNYPGGVVSFISAMNKKAKKLNLHETNFSDPAGLSDSGYTTVFDLARLTSFAIKDETIARVTGTKEKVITNVDSSREYAFSNLNKLLGLEGVVGVKTGFTQEAGEVLITAKVEDGHTFIVIVMKSRDRFLDTQKLLSFLSNNVAFFTP